MKPPVVLEVCVDSVESAVAAQRGGAKRVELCGDLVEGGTTPSVGTIEIVRKNLSIAVHVMIRPRGGDFRYSDFEYEVMMRDIAAAKRLDADGVVLGILTAKGNIDVKRTRALVKAARPMSVTFHRAFDVAKNPLSALEDLIEIGIDRLLTSGQRKTALAGSALIARLIKRAGGRIVIMPGCGINAANAQSIIEKTGATELHVASAVTKRKKISTTGTFVFGNVNTVDEKKVRQIIKSIS
jgi:copper homeostasis protein